MKRLKIVLIFLLFVSSAKAQPKSATNQPPQTLQQWLDNNVDMDALPSFDIDTDQIRDFFNKVQASLAATNIYDLADLKAIALQVLPVLDEFEETTPYAAWLRAHLDDLDAAGEMRREMKAASTNGATSAVLPRPTLKMQRSVWVKELANRPWPPLAHKYVPKLKEVFLSENVPPALVWVAGVESSFEPKARSPVGAAGMFQLMPDTARTEHLSLWPFDERYQPEKSAHAAARFLRRLHHHYGNWELALAAYNVGPARVDKLLKEHKVRSFDMVARWLPVETQMYVPKVEATIRLREGLALADLRTPRG